MSSEIARRLSEQTGRLLSKFEGRVDSFSGRTDLLGLTRELEGERADAFAARFFGEGEFLAYGVDGSMGFDERLQMMLFYANATAYSCPFRVGRTVKFDLASVRREQGLSSSAAIPLWSEDFSEVLPDTHEIDMELEHSMERVPNAFMTLAELYLALRTLEKARIVFLDRPISGTHAVLSRDLRNLIRRGGSNLTRLEYDGSRASLLDLHLSYAMGSPATHLPVRRRLLPYRMVRELLQGPLSVAQLSERLSAGVPDVERAIRRLEKRHGGELFEATGPGRVSLRDGVSGYWERSVNLATRHAERVFEGDNPLSAPGDEWLTLLDINALSFVLLERVCELARRRRVLLVGIAKDTTATDISRAVLPLAEERGDLVLKSRAPRLKNDRAFLTIMSSVNQETLRTPWRTVGYDAALSTMLSAGPQDGTERRFVSARKYVSRERLFVRGFFQSRTLGNNGRVRSRVFLFDRLFDDAEDSSSVTEVEVKEAAGVTSVEPYLEGRGASELSNMVLRILSLTDNPEVFEALGHNQLLYLADKAVKAEIRLMKGSLRGVADLRLGSMSRRERVYGLESSYREERSQAEGARRGAAGG